LDDFGSIGTHWVCCWKAKNGYHEYFDSFGLPLPDEWEQELKRMGKKGFLRECKMRILLLAFLERKKPRNEFQKHSEHGFF